jgi:hypothetical protein
VLFTVSPLNLPNCQFDNGRFRLLGSRHSVIGSSPRRLQMDATEE